MSDIRLEAVGVTIENVSLSFGTTEVLKGINLNIEAGEFFTFLGPSGSGKSTLLRAIAGFGPAPGGKILIGDDDVINLPPWKRNVGMVFQSYALWPHMTVRKNVAFGLEERKVASKEIADRVNAVLDMVGLIDYSERYPSQLSGGQQQRVALARTIVVEPRVLLLDEPLSNLDANLRVQVRLEILELQRKLNLTTIFVTHDQEEANTMSDRIAVLNNGVAQQVGTPIDIYDKPANRFVAGFLGTANFIDGSVEKVEGKTLFRSGDGTNIAIYDDSIQAGDGLTAMFRPQALSFGAATDENSANGSVLTGHVRHREFLGSLIRYSVQTGEHMILAEDSHQAGHQVLDIGEAVTLNLDVDQVRILSS
jgi:iron(III) transport system ATP-binding protein